MEKRLKKALKQVRLNEDTISMVLGSIVLIVVGILVYNYFTSLNKGQIASGIEQQASPTPGKIEFVEENGKTVPKSLPENYEVKKGDSLWTIAEDFYASGYNWSDIAKENGLKNANQIEVGQKLKLPKVEVKQATLVEKKVTNGIEGDSYVTKSGDYLWNIAIRAYGDGYKWTKIYQANVDKIGRNPNRLAKELTLTIPR